MTPVGSTGYHPSVPGLSSHTTLASLAREMLCGISYIHSMLIVHADLKPDNILLHNDTFLLSDFGSARTVPGDGLVSASPATVAFYPPEICQPDPPKAYSGFKADLWAAGLVLWCCMYNSLPYTLSEDENLIELIDAITAWRFNPTAMHDVSPDLVLVLKSLLSADPDCRRYSHFS